jgi:hypothetical protein
MVDYILNWLKLLFAILIGVILSNHRRVSEYAMPASPRRVGQVQQSRQLSRARTLTVLLINFNAYKKGSIKRWQRNKPVFGCSYAALLWLWSPSSHKTPFVGCANKLWLNEKVSRNGCVSRLLYVITHYLIPSGGHAKRMLLLHF